MPQKCIIRAPSKWLSSKSPSAVVCAPRRSRRDVIVTYEFATLEWLWATGAMRVNAAGAEERRYSGGYDEVVAVLSDLGAAGWDVATCASGGNWLFWTLRRAR